MSIVTVAHLVSTVYRPSCSLVDTDSSCSLTLIDRLNSYTILALVYLGYAGSTIELG